MVEKRVLEVGNRSYVIQIFDEMRRSARASITQKGIIIRVPRMITRSRREIEINNLLAWAHKRLMKYPTFQRRQKEYNHEDYLRTNCGVYQLSIERRPSQKNFAKVEGRRIIFKVADQHENNVMQDYISKQLKKLLAKQHLQDLENHLHRLNRQHFNQQINKIEWKYTRSRWGACRSKKKEIDLSTKLLLAPLPVLEYVIIHELAHLIQPNHSRAFWDLVERADPTYKEKVRWLKENGHTLIL